MRQPFRAGGEIRFQLLLQRTDQAMTERFAVSCSSGCCPPQPLVVILDRLSSLEQILFFWNGRAGLTWWDAVGRPLDSSVRITFEGRHTLSAMGSSSRPWYRGIAVRAVAVRPRCTRQDSGGNTVQQARA